MPPVGGVNKFKGVDAFKFIHEAPHTVMVFTAFDVVVGLMLYCFVCVRCFWAVAFVGFSVAVFGLLATGKGVSPVATGDKGDAVPRF